MHLRTNQFLCRGKSNKGGKGGSKAREQRKEEEAKSMGSLAGIATLRRSGDVVVGDEESHKIVTSTFTVGPLQLEVSKTVSDIFFPGTPFVVLKY